MTVLRLGDFEGRWQVERDIVDRRADLRGRFEGTATFAPAGDHLRYSEEGCLAFGASPPVKAERQYLWSEQDGRILVAFADGRPFHDFAPDDPGASHFCAPDDYVVRYDFTNWPDWSAEWTVRGPRKDYTMTSRYSPAPRTP
ncbi:DUF6314 family protein [Defluviimonas sp. WL0002]|uniref:DUF6314 family protein n=1 Tax=Albidovulum marisflavi TaxID=2984159 RepID=A0ABT2ZB90_9RHOB|nr:DUF6314 family protein [Defluviimonas sp. WL0002]MCV2868356.1 DUF6314 family protein [Defluviimonas sp. WL0002]